MTTEQDILRELAKINDPDFGRDIVSLGFVKDVTISGGEVSFTIELTTPACPVKAEFQRQAETLVRALPGVDTVSVNMTSKPVQRTPAEFQVRGLENIKSIVAVSSCKGGVGKSTIAAMLAKEISQRGYDVGLFDADMFGPSVPTLFNLHDVSLQADENNKILPVDVDGLKIVSYGFLLKNEPAVLRGPLVSRYLQQLLLQVNWGNLDYLFLDMPPGTGDIQLTITQSIQIDGALIITTPQALSLMDVEKGIKMFDKVNVPILGVIENMAYFECNKCGEKHFIFGTGGAEKLSARFGIDVLAQLPLSNEQFGMSLEKEFVNEEMAQATDEVVKAVGRTTIAKAGKPEVDYDSERITVIWQNGETVSVNNRLLRANCKCALCINELTGEKMLDESTIPTDIAPEHINVIGNYALQISWSDGHSAGLYSYKLIRELAHEEQEAEVI